MVLILLFISLLSEVQLQAPDEGCSGGSCNPQIGDLMVGRAAQLSASSTCGLDGPQNYCIIGYLEEEQKCFSCDSRRPFDAQFNPNSHRIENVITTFEPERKMKWWQSENGIHKVSIRLDLETIFQFSHLVLTFKSFRPAAMLVERSQDFGHSWKVFRYFSEDCSVHFPHVSKQTPDSIDDVVCDSRYSGSEPSTEGEVVLKALDPVFEIEDPYAPHIQELITMTNLRINFTRLFTLGDTLLTRKRRNPVDKYYYALYEMVVRGSCFCNGHAAQCTPANGRGDVFTQPGMVHGQCVCQHNTAGFNCEKCQDFHHDSPGGLEEKTTLIFAECLCKANVEGQRCDRCKPGHFGLRQDDPLGCQQCSCHPLGSVGPCDVQTGVCQCEPVSVGPSCDRCVPGHFGLVNGLRCAPCDCDIGGAVSTTCDSDSGQCQCLPNMNGRRCSDPQLGYFLPQLDYFLYEAELAAPLEKSPLPLPSPVPPSPIQNPIILPECEQYYREQGYDIKISNGQVVLVRRTKRNARRRRQYGAIPLEPGNALQIIPRERNSGRPITWTGLGFVRVLTGAGLRFTLGLIPSIEAVQGLCSQTELDSFRSFRCIGLAAEAGPHDDLPEVCEGLIRSMSARIYKGAIACGCNSEGSLGPYCSKLGGACECKPNVIGRCCDSCAPQTYGFGPEGCKPCDCDPRGSESELCDQVRGQCACRREVSGRRCDRCQPGYWGFPHCRVCECNALSEICDQETGHCIDCREHSAGPHCESCVEGYYGSPESRVPCEPCLCPDLLETGRFFASSCERDPDTQRLSCRCREGHTGPQCERCSPGYFGDLLLSGARCEKCECHNNIDPNDVEACDGVSGECLRCLHNTGGRHCEECKPGYYGNAPEHDCKECSCDRRGTEVTLCPVESPCFCDVGQDSAPAGDWSVSVSPEYGGRKCDECGENHFGNPDLQCVWHTRPACDSETGECNCRVGVTGIFCDECAPGYDSTFPECKECHACESAQNMRTFIPRPPNELRPGAPRHQQQLRSLFMELDNLRKNMTKPTSPRVSKMEALFQKILKLKNSIDPNCILLDPTPLLNTEIDNIDFQFKSLLSRLRNKVENPDDEDDEDAEDLLEDVKRSFESFKAEELQVKNASNAVEDSADMRLETKRKLGSCGGETLLGPLEKKVKALSIVSFNKQICGGSGLGCSACGGALCLTWLFGRKCGGPDCDGIVSETQEAIDTAQKTQDAINALPLKIQEAKDEMDRVNQTAQETKAQSKNMQDRINSSKEDFEKDKDKIKELIKKVKDYLLDDLLPAEDIEKMARAVLNINLPRSPEQIRALIQELTDLMKNATNSDKDVKDLEEQARIAEELKKRALELKNRTKDINVSDIKKDIYDAEKAQDKANDDLDAASQDQDMIRDQLQEMKDKLDEAEAKLMDPRLEDLNKEIEAVKKKTEQNREQASEAKKAAESALNNALDALPGLTDVLDKFDLLKNKKSNQTQDSEGAKRLEEIKKEAEALKKDLEDKLKQLEDLEKWLEELNKSGQDKAAEVEELLKQADSLRDAITRRAEEYVKCQ
ncbi:hypothetical protein WMY93_022273 [Mugilogobius chulae]|uniref:Laminin subunit beta-4 n=1 Tax=Mugilogobius chulae TaxID=88201 RepID=A0AAW0NDK4_9GOBI